MGDDPLALDVVAEVLADVVGADLLDEGGAGQVDGREPAASALERSLVVTRRMVAHRRADVCRGPTVSGRVVVGRARQDGRHDRRPGPSRHRGDADARPRQRRERRRDGQARRGGRRQGAAARRPAAPRRTSSARRAAPRTPRAPGDSGLYRLIELHAFNAAGDAAVAISLAGTLFFRCPPGEARGQVALFLGLTMLPFAIVAPLIGPFLDRFSHGRRWAIGSTMALRAFLCWVLADAVATESIVAVPGRARRAGRVQGVRRRPGPPPSPACCRSGSPWSRRTPGSRWPASSAPRSRRRWRCWRRSPGPSGRCATRSCVFVGRHDPRDPAAREGRLEPAARAPVLRGSGGTERKKVRVPRRGGVRAARATAGLRLLSGFLTHVHGVPAARAPVRPAGRTGAPARPGDRRGRARQHHRHRARRRCCSEINPELTVVVRAARRRRRRPLVAALFYGLIPALALLGLVGRASARRWASSRWTRPSSATCPSGPGPAPSPARETLLQLSWVIGGFIGIALPLKLGAGRPRRRPRPARRADGRVDGVRARRARPAAGPGAPTAPGGRSQSSSSSASAAQQLGRRLGGLARRGAGRRGSPADALEQPDQVLDDADHLVGLLALGVRRFRAPTAARRAPGPGSAWSPLRPCSDAELDPGAGLERGDSLGQRRGADVDVVARPRWRGSRSPSPRRTT